MNPSSSSVIVITMMVSENRAISRSCFLSTKMQVMTQGTISTAARNHQTSDRKLLPASFQYVLELIVLPFRQFAHSMDIVPFKENAFPNSCCISMHQKRGFYRRFYKGLYVNCVPFVYLNMMPKLFTQQRVAQQKHSPLKSPRKSDDIDNESFCRRRHYTRNY